MCCTYLVYNVSGFCVSVFYDSSTLNLYCLQPRVIWLMMIDWVLTHVYHTVLYKVISDMCEHVSSDLGVTENPWMFSSLFGTKPTIFAFKVTCYQLGFHMGYDITRGSHLTSWCQIHVSIRKQTTSWKQFKKINLHVSHW